MFSLRKLLFIFILTLFLIYGCVEKKYDNPSSTPSDDEESYQQTDTENTGDEYYHPLAPSFPETPRSPRPVG